MWSNIPLGFLPGQTEFHLWRKIYDLDETDLCDEWDWNFILYFDCLSMSYKHGICECELIHCFHFNVISNFVIVYFVFTIWILKVPLNSTFFVCCTINGFHFRFTYFSANSWIFRHHFLRSRFSKHKLKLVSKEMHVFNYANITVFSRNHLLLAYYVK